MWSHLLHMLAPDDLANVLVLKKFEVQFTVTIIIRIHLNNILPPDVEGSGLQRKRRIEFGQKLVFGLVRRWANQQMPLRPITHWIFKHEMVV